MTEQLKCDNCEQTFDPKELAVNWLELRYVASFTSWSLQSEWHFCSWKCVGNYATVRYPRKGQS